MEYVTTHTWIVLAVSIILIGGVFGAKHFKSKNVSEH